MLLEAGATVDPIWDLGTPLHFAAYDGNVRAAQLLVKFGADAALDRRDNTPADLAAARGHFALASWLRSAAAMQQTPEGQRQRQQRLRWQRQRRAVIVGRAGSEGSDKDLKLRLVTWSSPNTHARVVYLPAPVVAAQ